MFRKGYTLHLCIALLVLFAMCSGIRATADPTVVNDAMGTLQNGYIGVAIGQQDWFLDMSATNSAGLLRPDAVEHDLISGTGNTEPGMTIPTDEPIQGRFYLWTTGGDPTNTEDDNQGMIYNPLVYPTIPMPIGRIADWQIMLDHNSQTQLGIAEGAITPDPLYKVWSGPYPTGITSALWGDQLDGTWTTPLTVDTATGTLSGSFEPWEFNTASSSTTGGSTGSTSGSSTTSGLFDYRPLAGGAPSPPGGSSGSGSGSGSGSTGTVTTNGLSGIVCTLEARLFRDTVRWKWTFTNLDTITRQVGLRLNMDEMLEPNDIGTDTGENVVSIGNGPFINKPTVLSDSSIPSRLEIFNSAKNPVMSFRQMFSGQGATMPDKVGVDEWMNLVDLNPALNPTLNPDPRVYWPSNVAWTYGADYVDHYSMYSAINNFEWLYTPPVQDNIYTDVATGAFWAPKPIAPGGSLTIITYTGLGCASSNFTTPSIDNPLYIAATQSPRTLQYVTDTNGNYQLYPSPFDISAYIDNVGSKSGLEDLTNAKCTLILPDGLSLDASENGVTTKPLPDIPIGTEASTSWKVVPTGTVTGKVKYFVTYSADPVGGTTVSREIYIPAMDKEAMNPGWQMITVPFNVSTTDPISALGLNGYATGFWQYNPTEGVYEPVTQLVPGKAYWLKMASPLTASLTVQHSAVDWSANGGYTLPLKVGWNMIGNPYLYSMTIGQASFYTQSNSKTVDFDTAVSQGLISRFLFNWDGTSTSYTVGSDKNTELAPWKGYWLKVLQPGVVMTFGPVTQIGAGVGGAPANGNGGNPIPPPAPQ